MLAEKSPCPLPRLLHRPAVELLVHEAETSAGTSRLGGRGRRKGGKWISIILRSTRRRWRITAAFILNLGTPSFMKAVHCRLVKGSSTPRSVAASCMQCFIRAVVACGRAATPPRRSKISWRTVPAQSCATPDHPCAASPSGHERKKNPGIYQATLRKSPRTATFLMNSSWSTNVLRHAA